MKKRSFLPQDFVLKIRDDIKPYIDTLMNEEFSDKQQFLSWLAKKDELEAFLSENFAWRYIHNSCHTDNQLYKEDYLYFVQHISPMLQEWGNKLDQKMMSYSDISSIDHEGLQIYFRDVKNTLELFREANIPLFTQDQECGQKFQEISGARMVTIEDKEYTLQQAAVFFENQDRTLRQSVWEKTHARRFQDQESLHDILDQLVKIRTQIASNAGFSNYRDYKFQALGRFDYTQQHVDDFRTAIEQEVMPLVNDIIKIRKEKLGVDILRPRDMEVDINGIDPLKPFEDGKELLEKSITCLEALHPSLADHLREMKEKNLFDLESRKGKAPGGYNYPLAETKAPFIFMNAAGTLRDLVTMVHEAGHAVHTFAVKDLEHTFYTSPGSEMNEVASMAMELMSMEHRDVFFPNVQDLVRAKINHLEDILMVLPWIATIDAFQGRLYLNPNHSHEQRTHQRNMLMSMYESSIVDWKGYEQYRDIYWQKQMHIFEVPFYYIEYGIAQLGAIAVWKNYKQHPEQALQKYLDALKLGYTKPLPELYATAGISFDFSAQTIRELMQFVSGELKNLYDQL